MSLFKGLWGKNKDEGKTRDLKHPRDLQQGDFIKLKDSFSLPELIRNKTLEVKQVNTSQFEYEHYPEFVLQGNNRQKIHLSLEEEDDALAFSIRLKRTDVETLFDMDQFAEIFEVDGQPVPIRSRHTNKDVFDMDDAEDNDDNEDVYAFIEVINDIDKYDGWYADAYDLECKGERGYFYDKDYRHQSPPATDEEGEPFDYFSLLSKEETEAIEIEVWESGETDVMLTIYRPVSDIEELWPAKPDVSDID